MRSVVAASLQALQFLTALLLSVVLHSMVAANVKQFTIKELQRNGAKFQLARVTVI